MEIEIVERSNKLKTQLELEEMVKKANGGNDPQDFSHQDMRCLKLGKYYAGMRVHLNESNLSYANLSEMSLECLILDGCDLTNANLEGSNITDGSLIKANLTNANLEGCKLSYQLLGDTNFTNANLKGANFESSDFLPGCIWNGANLTGAYYGFYRRDKLPDEKIMMEKPPVVFCGDSNQFGFDILILDKYIRIGCQIHTYKKWLGMTESDVEEFGDEALTLFQKHRYEL
ncbi:MAG TPA: pentapeptide repeat-containing protein, partial [Phormidium sp.]